MKKGREIQENGLKITESIPDMLIGIENNYKLFIIKRTTEKYLKKKMEDIYEKLENDFKWYKESLLTIDFEQPETIKENKSKETVDKKFSEKTASRLVEEWWLSS